MASPTFGRVCRRQTAGELLFSFLFRRFIPSVCVCVCFPSPFPRALAPPLRRSGDETDRTFTEDPSSLVFVVLFPIIFFCSSFRCRDVVTTTLITIITSVCRFICVFLSLPHFSVALEGNVRRRPETRRGRLFFGIRRTGGHYNSPIILHVIFVPSQWRPDPIKSREVGFPSIEPVSTGRSSTGISS